MLSMYLQSLLWPNSVNSQIFYGYVDYFICLFA